MRTTSEERIASVNRLAPCSCNPLVALGVGNDDQGDGLVSAAPTAAQSTSTGGMPRRTLSPALTLGLSACPQLDGVHADVNEQLDSAGGS